MRTSALTEGLAGCAPFCDALMTNGGKEHFSFPDGTRTLGLRRYISVPWLLRPLIRPTAS